MVIRHPDMATSGRRCVAAEIDVQDIMFVSEGVAEKCNLEYLPD
jgi:hypothetical protein